MRRDVLHIITFAGAVLAMVMLPGRLKSVAAGNVWPDVLFLVLWTSVLIISLFILGYVNYERQADLGTIKKRIGIYDRIYAELRRRHIARVSGNGRA